MLKKYMQTHRSLLFFAMLFNAAYSVVSVLVAFLLSGMINAAMEGNPEGLKQYAVLSVCYLAAVLLLGRGGNYFQGLFTRNVMRELRQDVFRAIIRRNYRSFNTKTIGEYLSILSNDMDAIESSGVDSLFAIVDAAVTFLVAVAALLYIDVSIILAACLVGAFYLFVSWLLSRNLSSCKDAWFRTLEGYTVRAKELLSGHEVIDNLGVVDRIDRAFRQANEAESEAGRRYGLRLENLNVTNVALGQGLVIVILGVCSWIVLAGAMAVGSLVAVAQLMTNLITPLTGFVSCVNEIRASGGIYRDVAELLAGVDGEEETGLQEKSSFERDITLRDVSFSYGEGEPVLRHVNLTLEKNHKYAVVGASGSGKSTLVKLLLNYFPDYSGEICLDGCAYRDIRSESFQRLFSITQQNIFLFDGTIRENLTLFQPISEKEVERAVRFSGLERFLRENRASLDTQISENDAQLSGGERQSIAIARALLMRKSILIFDEATASLDRETAADILSQVLSIPDLTCIVVTHKLREVDPGLYDAVLEVRDGEVSFRQM
ncbi:MAG: ABC transporter ATP-binding protein/permease [Lachnospiraceae bacterium]|nr:ABC transporter ATP-binding protein/permease [Lachnospiraceae bacterium]